MQKLKFYRIGDPLYKQNFTLCIGAAPAAKKYFSKVYNIQAPKAGQDAICVTLERGEESRSFIWVKGPNMGSLAHECLHRAIEVLDYCGVKLDPHNDEPLTYYFSYIFEQCYEVLYSSYKKEKTEKKNNEARKSKN